MDWVFSDDKIDPALPLVDRILEARGLGDSFLNVSHEGIHSFDKLGDVERASEVVANAIKAGKKIFIHGDYDVDGVSATAILWHFLHYQAGAIVMPYIPNRFDEGYGLSHESIKAMLSEGAELIITVDCGIRDVELVSEYSKNGTEFIITDHHTIQDGNLPPAAAVVHPSHPDFDYPFTEICGAMVAWKLAQAVAAKLDLQCDMGEYLDLVALATVCDVMTLTDENRAAVKLGLERMQKYQRPGIYALLKAANVPASDLKAYHFGFVLGPRLNAAGRIDSAMLALRLLATVSRQQAQEIATQLEELNLERQRITQELMEKAEEQIASEGAGKDIYFIVGENWSEGVLGLVAGRMADKYYKPVFVASINNEGEVKGSARSIPGLHIAEALASASKLLDKFGGHSQAAGFSLKEKNVDKLKKQLLNYANDKLNSTIKTRQLKIDALLQVEDLNLETIESLEQLEPYGLGNPRPVLALLDTTLKAIRKFGKQNTHLSLKLELINGQYLDAIVYSASDFHGQLAPGQKLRVAGTLDTDKWTNSPSLTVKDLMLE